MKNVLYTLLLLVCCIGLSSCGNDDDGRDNKDVEGNWDVVFIEPYIVEASSNEQLEKDLSDAIDKTIKQRSAYKYIFKSSSIYQIFDGKQMLENGRYAFEDGTMTFVNEQGTFKTKSTLIDSNMLYIDEDNTAFFQELFSDNSSHISKVILRYYMRRQ